MCSDDAVVRRRKLRLPPQTRPVSRRNRIIPQSERTADGEQTSRGRHGPQSIRQAANDSKASDVQFRPTAVGDEKWRHRRPSNAADVEAHDESFQSETRARVCARARARTRACCVCPRGAKQKAVGARAFARHVPNDSPRWTGMITGRLNAAPLIRIARLPPAGQRREVAHATSWARRLVDAPPARESCRYRSGFLQIESRRFRGSKEPDGCAHGDTRRFEAPINRQRRAHASKALRSGPIVVRNHACESAYATCSLHNQERYQRSLGVGALAS